MAVSPASAAVSETAADAGPIRVGISACLLGEPVRYDGAHKYAAFIQEQLGRLFELVPICPEVAIGLGVPRDPIRLVQEHDGLHARGVARPELDVTRALVDLARGTAERLAPLAGYIFKQGSPSCGIGDVRLWSPRGETLGRGWGVYARALQEWMPLLPMEDEGSLDDTGLRGAFIERVGVYHHWQALVAGGLTSECLIRFHSVHGAQIRRRDSQSAQALDRILAELGSDVPAPVSRRYIERLMQGLRRGAAVLSASQ
jgi:uncharacterized protein YbbK (DUF523 family)